MNEETATTIWGWLVILGWGAAAIPLAFREGVIGYQDDAKRVRICSKILTLNSVMILLVWLGSSILGPETTLRIFGFSKTDVMWLLGSLLLYTAPTWLDYREARLALRLKDTLTWAVEDFRKETGNKE